MFKFLKTTVEILSQNTFKQYINGESFEIVTSFIKLLYPQKFSLSPVKYPLFPLNRILVFNSIVFYFYFQFIDTF